MRVAFIGYGNVGSALATAAVRAGNDVVLAALPGRADGAESVRAAHPALSTATTAPVEEAVAGADLVVLAVPFAALDALVAPLAPLLEGRVVVDATNPVGPGLTHGLGSRTSGAEHVAALAPGARVVKGFSVYGYENLAEPATGPAGLRPVMPLAGDDEEAVATVARFAAGLGWEPLHVGGLAAALDLEHLTLLWVRLVRGRGLDPHLVWAALRPSPG